jgi:hypothetical protein
MELGNAGIFPKGSKAVKQDIEMEFQEGNGDVEKPGVAADGSPDFTAVSRGNGEG